MRSTERNDVTLLVGIAIAALVTFRGPISQFLQIGQEIEEQYGLALVPGLAILISVLLGNHLMARFRRAARQRRERESTHALALSRGLAHTTSRDTVRDVLRNGLPAVAETDEAWVVIRENGEWNPIVGGGTAGLPTVTRTVEEIVTKLVDGRTDLLDGPAGKRVADHLCFPVMVGESIAVLGVPHDAAREGEEERTLRLAAVATSIGMALRNAQLLVDMEEEQGVIDGLTGCFNRTHGMKILDTELKRAKRARTSLAVAMLDLDYFKAVNDQHGHLCGDALLTAVGKKLQEMLRNSDIKCRYGGEEFLILLPDTPIPGAIHVGDMLRTQLEQVSVEWNGKTVSTTASIGIAAADPGELDPKALVGRADDALYRAKNAGRNRVCVDGADDNPGVPPSAQPAGGPGEAVDAEAPNSRRTVTAAAS